MSGREAIRSGIGAFQREPAFLGTVDAERSGFELHETGDPDVFIAEVDATLVASDGGARPSRWCRSSASATAG